MSAQTQAPSASPPPLLLQGLALLLLCQSTGEMITRGLRLPLPGPVLGMLVLVALLQVPAVRAPVGQAADALLGHLSLLFVPVGVGVMTHLALIAQHGLALALALLLSTWIGMAVCAWVLQALLPPELPASPDSPLSVSPTSSAAPPA